MIGASSPVVATSWSRCQRVAFVRGGLQNANGPMGGKPLIWRSDPRPICHKLYYRIESRARIVAEFTPRARVGPITTSTASSGIERPENYPSRVVRS